jgi:molybdopterin molybdotransferase
VRILTGANLPPGADSVAIVESTEEVARDRIRFLESVKPGAHILIKGENGRKGQPLLNAGVRLLPQQIAVCASVGVDPVPVYAQPRVAIVCTGEELVAASERPGPHEQRDSNGPALRAAVLATGLAQPRAVRVVEDVPERVRQRLRTALKGAEVVLVVGGVSAGKYDFVPGVLEELGCHKVFHRVRMKPGKPILFAIGPVKQLVFGLPGNPLSALTGFHEFVLPALEKMSGLPVAGIPRLTVRLERPLHPKPSGRIRLYPARVRFNGESAEAIAVPVNNENSADVAAGGLCDGALVLPEDRAYEAGEHLEFHPWGALRMQSWKRK